MPVLEKAQYELFCQLFASGKHKQSEAAKLAGFSVKCAKQQASRMLQRADIQARVAEIKEGIAVSMADIGIARKRDRIEYRQKMLEQLEFIRDSRSKNPMYKAMAGHESGLLIGTPVWINIPDPDDATKTIRRMIWDSRVDTAMIQSVESLMNSTARELGQIVSTAAEDRADEKRDKGGGSDKLDEILAVFKHGPVKTKHSVTSPPAAEAKEKAG